jgi:hypothetical protein
LRNLLLIESPDSLYSKFGEFEVQQKTRFYNRDIQGAKHLRHVTFVEGGSYFCIHNEIVFYDEIGNERPNQLVLVVDFECLLPVDSYTAFIFFNSMTRARS